MQHDNPKRRNKQMNTEKLRYVLHSGKNSKPKYYVESYARLCTPKCWLRRRLRRLLAETECRDDRDYILDRANYYCRLDGTTPIDRKRWDALAVETSKQPMTPQKVYYLDAMTVARWFPQDMRWRLLPGDINYVPDVPSVVKSRPIACGRTQTDNNPANGCKDNSNSVLLNLNKVRHFIFVKDKTAFADKKDMAVFRGKVGGKDNRKRFMDMFFGDPRIDAGAIDRTNGQWLRPKMSISDHLAYRYIMALEGNDVASNLKWVMSSNSIAVMPRPTNETWFMEGRLIPDYHYIEIKPDYSDLKEKLDYYSAHQDKAEAIISHANEYVAQFRDKHRELLIALTVMKKYLEKVNG